MKYISPFFSDARNKLGGSVFARNRSGVYARAKVNPTQPRTTSQQDNRANFGTFATDWKSLTQAQIAAWNQYAMTATLTDSLGHSFRPSGIQAFVSCNRYLSFIGYGLMVEPPASRPSFPSLAPAALEISNITGEGLDCAVEVPFDWSAWEDFVVISATPALSPGITFIRRSMYRRLSPPYTASGSVLFFTSNYSAVFPTPGNGQQVGIRMQLVDHNTGLAGPVVTVATLVQH